jgi:hypothetical protein
MWIAVDKGEQKEMEFLRSKERTSPFLKLT